MYRILIFLYNCFLNFVVQKMNSKMVKFGMVVLTGREKSDVADANVVVGWMLEPWWVRGREKSDVV
jgi:hypothetical protein